MPLKARYERYAQCRAKGMNGVKSYKAAGFSGADAKKSAWRLEKRADIQARIQELLAKQAEVDAKATQQAVDALAITRVDVLRELWDNAMKAKSAVPVYDREGNPTGEYQANINASNKALELFGKEAHRMFVDRKEVLTGPLDGLSHEELKQLRELLDGIDRPASPAEPLASDAPRITH